MVLQGDVSVDGSASEATVLLGVLETIWLLLALILWLVLGRVGGSSAAGANHCSFFTAPALGRGIQDLVICCVKTHYAVEARQSRPKNVYLRELHDNKRLIPTFLLQSEEEDLLE